MTAQILDGRAISRELIEMTRSEVAQWEASGQPKPTIVVVRVGDDPSSVRYSNQIERTFVGAGLEFRMVVLPISADLTTVLAGLRALNADPTVTGILLQFPLPADLPREPIVEAIDPAKDVDGVNPINAGRLLTGRGHYFAPATPLGGIELLHRSGIQISGRHAVVVGRSEIVGRPLAMLLLHQNATVTICHTRTTDLGKFTREAEILAVAAGRPGLIAGDLVRPGSTVIDFGTNVVEGKLVGDVDFASASDVAGIITPVPGGTGPMTNAVLLRNLLQAARWQHEH